MTIERVKTGIPGLDELIEGGFPRGRTILISGTCGTGKSTFGVQYIYNGITQYNENGILVVLEENPKELKEEMLRFNFDLQKQEDENKLRIISTDLRGGLSLEELSDIIPARAKEINARRAVIDSLSAIDFLIEKRGEERHIMHDLIVSISKMVKELNLTTLLMTEIPEGSELISQRGIESHIADGVIILKIHEAIDARKMTIRKMRGTKHSVKPVDIELTERGFVVKPEIESKKPIF